MTERCAKHIYGSSYTGHPCRNKGTYEVSGKLWCGTHNPDRICARKEAKANAREAQWAIEKSARSKAQARADRLSAAREGVVKALEELLACRWVSRAASAEVDAARAALKELEEASK